MHTQLHAREHGIYLKLLVKALHGARSTLRTTSPSYAERLTDLIDMPRNTADEIQMFLLASHPVILHGRAEVVVADPEAASLLDAIHNIPYGLLGRFDGTWDWRESLPGILRDHEDNHLRKLRKYSGLLAYRKTGPNEVSQDTSLRADPER